MKQISWNRVGRVVLSSVVAVTAASMLVGVEGGGHGGGGGVGAGGGGGSHAAPSGGGGGAGESHAAAPAASNSNASQSHGMSRPYNPYVPQSQRQVSNVTPRTEVHPNEATPRTGTNTNINTNASIRPDRAENRGDGRNRENRNYNGYGVVYGYPWYPFSYGWGDGWYGGYGTQYGYPGYVANGNYPFDLPYGDYDNQESLQANPPNSVGNASGAQSATVAQPAQTITNGYDNPSAQARATNAVANSPSMVQANNAVATAQSAYDAERERVLAALAQKPEYQAAVARRRQAAQNVQAASTQPAGHETAAVAAAANQHLEAGDEVTKMEEQAVAADPAAAAAKGRLQQAVSDRDALQAQLNAQVQQGQPQPR